MATNIISSLGAGSGIDSASLVKQLAEIERAPLEQRIATRETQLKAQISGYGKLKSALDGLKGALAPLASNDLFSARSVAFPNTDTITPTKVAPGAQAGSYQIDVQEVARAQSLAMATRDSRDSALGQSGDLTIGFGSYVDAAGNPTPFQPNDARASLTISVTANDSLQTIADKINATKSGVQASVLKVENQFQLMLTAPSGRTNAMQIGSADAGLSNLFGFDGADTASVTQTQAASDAKLKINGLTVYRETNEIKDVIEGFEFTLNKADPGQSVNFSIAEDKSTAETGIRAFIEAYNSFQTTARNLTGYSRNDDNELVRGELASDSTARTLVNQVRELLTGAVPGLQSGFTALTNVGIRTELNGSLSINDTEFKAAIADNFELIEGLFAPKLTSGNTAVTLGLGTYASQTAAGRYEATILQDPARGTLTANPLTHDFDADGPLTIAPEDDFSFKIRVDGAESETIRLSGTFASLEQLRGALQSQINGDSKLKAVGAAADVSIEGGAFKLVSRSYGSSSLLRFTEASADMARLGIATSGMTTTPGQDATGIVNGQAGFGAGEVLLPAIKNAAYGLNLTVRSGASAQGSFQIDFSRGLAGELTNLIEGFLGNTGTIKQREDSIQSQLTEVKDDRAKLDRRMEGVTARLMAQFSAMENIVGSLKTSGGQLDGLNDRLPFTAKY